MDNKIFFRSRSKGSTTGLFGDDKKLSSRYKQQKFVVKDLRRKVGRQKILP